MQIKRKTWIENIAGAKPEHQIYLDESGMDVEGMSKEELLEASEIFSLPDGTYLIVEG